ncbi:PREDICTED: uncharacterized protein LOC109167367 isoform X2 [Ipomoea nil]|uniref:uncharacterized protein LOC109167367 isoform X2 n=1 Tax=Ipomoea nil TaxID=35883 RepID=UPI000900C7DA|nr:PREDICTED: uncharacterized protein LOC109167367 isoform X2 [Ipomoea nil]
MVVGWETGGLCTVVGCCPVSWRLSTLFQKRRSPFWCSPTTKMVLAGDHGRGKRWGSSCAHVGRVSDDDFVSPPLDFQARLQQDLLWNAPDDDSSSEEESRGEQLAHGYV